MLSDEKRREKEQDHQRKLTEYDQFVQSIWGPGRAGRPAERGASAADRRQDPDHPGQDRGRGGVRLHPRRGGRQHPLRRPGARPDPARDRRAERRAAVAAGAGRHGRTDGVTLAETRPGCPRGCAATARSRSPAWPGSGKRARATSPSSANPKYEEFLAGDPRLGGHHAPSRSTGRRRARARHRRSRTWPSSRRCRSSTEHLGAVRAGHPPDRRRRPDGGARRRRGDRAALLSSGTGAKIGPRVVLMAGCYRRAARARSAPTASSTRTWSSARRPRSAIGSSSTPAP